MKYAFSTLAFGLSASAAVVSRQTTQCCFQLQSTGGAATGKLGQLSDGQNRVGPGFSDKPVTYCIQNGGITDGNGRGCILTPPTTQFQCDAGATPTTGFSIGSNGDVLYNGKNSYYACAATSNGVFNIYTQAVAGSYCLPVTLTTVDGKCSGSGVSSSASRPASSSAASSASSVASSASSSRPASSSASSSRPASSSASSINTSATTPATSRPQPSASSSAGTSSRSSVVVPSPSIVTVTRPVTVTVTAPCGVSSSVPPSATPSTCDQKMNACRTAPNANQAQCSSDYCQCLANSGMTSAGPSYCAFGSTSRPASASSSVVVPPVSSSSRPATSSMPAQSSSVPSSSRPATSSMPAQSSSVPSSSKPASSTTPAAPASTCPMELTGTWEYPHLIVPVSKKSPNTAAGTSYFGTVNSDTTSLFNFDIPASYAGKTCTVVFSLPTQAQLQTSSFTLSGIGSAAFQQLNSVASQSTTYANAPSGKDLGSHAVTPGQSFTVASGPCAAGTAVAYSMAATGSLDLKYFQDYNPCPIGLYVLAK